MDKYICFFIIPNTSLYLSLYLSISLSLSLSLCLFLSFSLSFPMSLSSSLSLCLVSFSCFYLSISKRGGNLGERRTLSLYLYLHLSLALFLSLSFFPCLSSSLSPSLCLFLVSIEKREKTWWRGEPPQPSTSRLQSWFVIIKIIIFSLSLSLSIYI